MRLLAKLFFTSFIFALNSCTDFDEANKNISPNYVKTSISSEEAAQLGAIDMAEKWLSTLGGMTNKERLERCMFGRQKTYANMKVRQEPQVN